MCKMYVIMHLIDLYQPAALQHLLNFAQYESLIPRVELLNIYNL